MAAAEPTEAIPLVPIATIELPCFECDRMTLWHQYFPGHVFHCEHQSRDIAEERARPTEYACMIISETGQDNFHRIAWWGDLGYVVFFPYGHDDCNRCDDAYVLFVKEGGFRCHCGYVSDYTTEFGLDLHRWLVGRMFGSLLEGWFEPAEWVNFPKSLGFILWRESRKIATMCFLRLGLSADLSKHILKFACEPPTAYLAAAIADEVEAGMLE